MLIWAPSAKDVYKRQTKTRDLLDELGCDGVISVKGFPLQAGARWVIERTNSWHNRGFKKLAICTERHDRVIDALIALANAVIITRSLLRQAWTTHRWDCLLYTSRCV